MNSALASIGKNLILLGVVALFTVNLIYRSLSWQIVFAAQCMAGAAYIFLSCYEYLNASYKASLPVQRYPYITNSFVMFRVLKTGIFLSFALLLYTSESSVKYLYPVCLTIGLTEAVVTFLKYKKSLCFVNIYANYLLIVETKHTRVFASEIALIEFRHGIFYFVKKNSKSVQIKLEHIAGREDFVKNISSWINRNNVTVSAESKEKIMAHKI